MIGIGGRCVGRRGEHGFESAQHGAHGSLRSVMADLQGTIEELWEKRAELGPSDAEAFQVFV